MPRFVILTHDWPHLHWDFLLEHEGVLWAWRLENEPRADVRISAERIPDHRIVYLDYEGPVSGDRGNVTRWDHGEYHFFGDSQTVLTVELHGRKIEGVLQFVTEGEKIWFELRKNCATPA